MHTSLATHEKNGGKHMKKDALASVIELSNQQKLLRGQLRQAMMELAVIAADELCKVLTVQYPRTIEQQLTFVGRRYGVVNVTTEAGEQCTCLADHSDSWRWSKPHPIGPSKNETSMLILFSIELFAEENERTLCVNGVTRRCRAPQLNEVDNLYATIAGTGKDGFAEAEPWHANAVIRSAIN